MPGLVTVFGRVNHLSAEPGTQAYSAWASPLWVGWNEYPAKFMPKWKRVQSFWLTVYDCNYQTTQWTGSDSLGPSQKSSIESSPLCTPRTTALPRSVTVTSPRRPAAAAASCAASSFFVYLSLRELATPINFVHQDQHGYQSRPAYKRRWQRSATEYGRTGPRAGHGSTVAHWPRPATSPTTPVVTIETDNDVTL